jgi:hypothetical protein
MKLTVTIALVVVLLVFCAGESCAQTSSSATQTVTFGVRIVGAEPLSASQSVALSDSYIESPFKVTVGTDLKGGEIVALGLPAVRKKHTTSRNLLFDGRNVALAIKTYPPQTSARSVLTITE